MTSSSNSRRPPIKTARAAPARASVRWGETQGRLEGPWRGSEEQRRGLTGLELLAARPRHDSALQLSQVCCGRGRWSVEFERVPGVDVLDWRDDIGWRIDLGLSISIVRQVAGFLAAAGPTWSHITRPEHLVLEGTGRLRIMDIEPVGAPALADAHRGPSDWYELLPPEILLGAENRTERMSVYAVGMLAAFLITGHRPLPAIMGRRGVVSVTRLRVRKTSLSRLQPLPAPVSDILDRATDPRPAARIRTLRTLVEALEAVAHPVVLDSIRRARACKNPGREDPLRFCA